MIPLSFPRFRHQRVKQRLLRRITRGRYFRMPLHRDQPGMTGLLERLNDAVRRRRHDAQFRRDILDRLVMPR